MSRFSDSSGFGFTRSDLRTLRALRTPAGIQRFLDDLPYNLSYTACSPRKVLHDRVASCLEGGIFAAAALRILGFPPLIFDLEAEQAVDKYGLDLAAVLAEMKQTLGVQGKKLFMPMRVALTGKKDGPELPAIMQLLGLHRIKHRLSHAFKLVA